MKRGRRSKAEKAALAAAAAAAAAAQAIGSDIEEVDLTGWTDEKEAREMASFKNSDRRFENKGEITIKTETVDSEDTLSAAGASTPLVPKSEASEGPDLTNGDVVIENGIATNGCSIKKEKDEQAAEEELLGNINGLPRACICEQTNLMGKILPAEGFEGSAILHNGSVLKVGCIVLLFNVVQ